jgi:Family of unknown function (DUF6941)
MFDQLDAPTVHFVMLAEFARVLEGKLYLMGGGADRLQVPGPDHATTLAIVIGIEIPWSAAGRSFDVEVRLIDEDNRELDTISGSYTLNVGPHAHGLKPGQSMAVHIAEHLPLAFPKAGTYQILARIAGVSAARALLYVSFTQRSG